MKLSKKAMLILGVSAFVVVLVSLGAVRSQQGGAEDLLKTKLAAAQTKLTAVQTGPLTDQQTTLQTQLDQALKDMAQAKDVFSKSSDSVATTATIFNVAQTQGVVIQEILSSGASSQMLEGITYTVLPVEIKVTGNVNALITFITALNQELGTGVIQTAVLNAPPNAVITVNTPGPTPKPDSGGVAPSTADIQMSIYTYRGN